MGQDMVYNTNGTPAPKSLQDDIQELIDRTDYRQKPVNIYADMKVFKIGDCDWMAAESLETAIKEYENITGETLILDETDIKECSLSEKMWCGFTPDELEKYLRKTGKEYIVSIDDRGDYPLAAKLEYKEVIEIEGRTDPYMIASTEY